jgi:MoaA/NifB/PqqE/SkfB family radical SAM enzyme
MPIFLQIEPTNRCNLECRLCVTGSKNLKRDKRDMSLKEFVNIIDQLEESVFFLVLYNLGEPLLNVDIYRMIEYAKKKRIFVKLNSNGDFKDKKHIKNIINCGLDELTISLDCVTPYLYSRYKSSDSFENVIENIGLLIKERCSSPQPYINIQLLLMRENESEIHRFKRLVKEFKADAGVMKKLRVDFPGVAPERSFLPLKGRYVRKIYKNNYHRKRCLRPWISTLILCDNSVIPCCFDMQGDCSFGMVYNHNFKQIWNNDSYLVFRKKILEDINKIGLCKQCSAIEFFDNFA